MPNECNYVYQSSSERDQKWSTLGTSYKCEIGWSDAAHSGSGDMEDGVTLDVPSSLLFSSGYFFTLLLLWISAQYKWRRHGFLPTLETRQVEVDFPGAPDPPKGYHTVLIGCGIYGFIRLRTLNSCLIVSYSFLLLYGFVQPRGTAPKEGDNVMARLHVTCPGPGNTRFI